jgi:hypothetical protein
MIFIWIDLQTPKKRPFRFLKQALDKYFAPLLLMLFFPNFYIFYWAKDTEAIPKGYQ